MGNPAEPKTLAGFELIQKLGQGGMGAVYRARHPRTKAEVAIKVVLAHLGQRSEVQERFKREVKAMASVEHPNLIRVLEAGVEDGHSYCVMQLVDGKDLAGWVNTRGRMKPKLLIQVARGILGALGALHKAGIVHRDLKPHNVMLDTSGRALVMDLGLIRMADALTLTKTGALIGSPRYMSPEVLHGVEVDGRSDLYQTGLILWECAAGTLAVPGDDFHAVSTRILTGDIQRIDEKLPGFPPRLAAVIHRLIEVEPEDRFPTAEDALAALDGEIEPDHDFGSAADRTQDGPGLLGAPPTPALPLAAAAPPPRRGVGLAGVLSFLGFFAVGYWLTSPAELAPPERVEVVAGVRRVAARWAGALHTPVQLVVEDGAGGVRASPPSGLAVVPRRGDGDAELVVDDLEGGREYTAYLRYPAGRTLPRRLEVPGDFLAAETRGRLVAEDDGALTLEVISTLPTRLRVEFPTEGEDASAEAGERAESHRVRLPGLDPAGRAASLRLEFQDPAGTRGSRTLELGPLLTAPAERFRDEVAPASIEAAIRELKELWRKNDPDERRKEIPRILDEVRVSPPMREFRPFRDAFFRAGDVPSDLRVAVVNRIELLRRLARCVRAAGDTLEPDPSQLLGGAYAKAAGFAPGFRDQRIPAKGGLIIGRREPSIDPSRKKRMEGPLAALPFPLPEAARLSLDREGRMDPDLFLEVSLPGGLRLLFFGEPEFQDPQDERWQRRGVDPRDLPTRGGTVTLTHDSNFLDAVAGEVRVTSLAMGWRGP